MKILAVDTATAAATAALAEDGRLIAEYTLRSSRAHSQKLMGLISELLDKSGITPGDIDVYACSAGPGSFTGLRIGASIIKGMAQVYKKPVAAVPTLDALAYNLYNCSGYICPMLDAQRGMAYSALYAWEQDRLVKKEDFGAIPVAGLIHKIKDYGIHTTFLGDGVQLLAEAVKDGSGGYSVAPDALLLPRASSCAALAYEMYKNGGCGSYDSFKLTYIRKSQAEVEYEKKHRVEICEMKPEDIDAVCRIENLSFVTPWSREAFQSELFKNNLARYVVAKVDGAVAGYGGMWVILDEGHITNIAVHPEYRGQGIGVKLVNALIGIARESGAKSITLEVRESNTAARHLYRKLGFEDQGVRKKYYSDTGEDAIIMWKHNI